MQQELIAKPIKPLKYENQDSLMKESMYNLCVHFVSFSIFLRITLTLFFFRYALREINIV